MCRRSLTVLLAAVLVAGCGRPPQGPAPQPPDPAAVQPVLTPPLQGIAPPGGPVTPAIDPYTRLHDDAVNGIAVLSRQERYDAALLDAIGHVADQKYKLALLDLQTAQGLVDTETVRAEIARVGDLLAQQETAAKTVLDLQTVLKDGTADAAGRLSDDALKQFGGADQGAALAEVKRQAEALRLVSSAVEATDRNRLLLEADAAVKDDNLRAAAIAFEVALANAPADDPLRRNFETIRTRLRRYDEQRELGNRLRRARATLEDALPALLAAQEAWDTPQVRSDLEEVRFALSHCRERLSVADFEVRGDIGWPGAGRTVSDALLGGFGHRYDLVERGHLDQVLGELKLEGAALGDDEASRREVGRLARLKYLVVGSVTPLNGVTVYARLVNVQTGLIEQTARLSAPTLDDLVKRLDVLAQMLQMNDRQRLEFEARLAADAAGKAQGVVEVQPIVPLSAEQPLPPAPVFQADQPPPPPVVAFAGGPVNLGASVVEVFADLRALPPPVLVEVQPVLVIPPPPPLRPEPRGRLLALSLELGDNLFRRGRHKEAQRHFELALSLSGGNADVQLRLDRCRPFLPPPPPPVVVVTPPPLIVVNPAQGSVVLNNPFLVQPPPPPPPLVVVAAPAVVRPRIIVFSFLVNTRPGLVPPALGDWASDYFASYFGPRYEVIDRGELCWYMGRLNITMRDVLNDPAARWSLSQALNARSFVFGTIQETASFDVVTNLMDAQTGKPTATGMIHVQTHEELKLRMGELTAQLGGTPAQQVVLAQQGKDSEVALKQVRDLQAAGKFKEAVEAGRSATQKYPDSIALRTTLQQVTAQQHQAERDAQIRAEGERQAKALEEARHHQEELARKSAEARLKAEAEAKARTAADQERLQVEKNRAYDRLVKEGQQAFDRGAYDQAAQTFRGAVALKPDPAGFDLMAKAEKARDLAHKELVTQEAKKKADAEAASRAEAIARLAEARKQEEARNSERRQHDADHAAQLAAQARKDIAAGKNEEALSAARTAQSLHPTPEAQQLVSQAEHALELKRARGDQERKEIEALHHNQEVYAEAMKKGGEALAVRKYADAVVQYDAAVKLFRTDAALGGLKGAQNLLERDKAAQEAEKNKAAELERRTAEIHRLLGTAKQRLEARQFKEAEADYDLVLKADPGSVEARSGKAQVASARADAERKNAAETERVKKKADYELAMGGGEAAVKKLNYQGAVNCYREALRILPGDASATTRLEATARLGYSTALEKGRAALKALQPDAAVTSADEALRFVANDKDASTLRASALALKTSMTTDGKKREDYTRMLTAARASLTARKPDEALGHADDALKLFPGDKDATALRAEAVGIKAKMDSEGQARQRFTALLTEGKADLAAKKPEAAIKDADEALKLVPGDKEATALRTEALALKAKMDGEGQVRQRLTGLVTSGRAALAAKKPDEAIKNAEDALKLAPGDKDATALLNESRAAKTALAEAGMKAETTRLVGVGRAAFNARKFDEALKSANEALKLAPNDPAAVALRKEAAAAQDAEIKKAELARLLNQAQLSLAAKKYPEAEKEFTQALALAPNDPTATRGLKEARDGQRPPAPANPQAEYTRQYQAGQNADKLKHYAEAATAYREALKAVPADPKATAALKTADFNQHMEEGRKQLAAKKFPEAQAEFEAALVNSPTDADAKALLQKAKDRKP